jgi:hypothetical protein
MARVLQLQLKICLYTTAVQLHDAKNMTTITPSSQILCRMNPMGKATTNFLSLPATPKNISSACHRIEGQSPWDQDISG